MFDLPQFYFNMYHMQSYQLLVKRMTMKMMQKSIKVNKVRFASTGATASHQSTPTMAGTLGSISRKKTIKVAAVEEAIVTISEKIQGMDSEEEPQVSLGNVDEGRA